VPRLSLWKDNVSAILAFTTVSVLGSGKHACFALILLGLAEGCGSRTPLYTDEPDACPEPGASRECSNDCGVSTQQCVGGFWSACVIPVSRRPCSSICGKGTETCMDGKWQNCDAPLPGPPKLKVTIRDFKDTHPDMERAMMGGLDTGIVTNDLGPDDKPVYAGTPTTFTTSGRMFFDEWYRDTPGVNMTTTKILAFRASPTNPEIYVYDDDQFFPIDNELFGNQDRPHNYHFTVELATAFRYVGGETFSFAGDDDLWVFINRKLAINLGGIHQSLSATVDLDQRSAALGIAKGNVYPFNLFFAERHTVDSHFHAQTSIAEFDACQ